MNAPVVQRYMSKTFLLIGGNTGDRLANLRQATDLIDKKCGPLLNASSIYETAAWGKTDQPSFLNQALEMETLLEPLRLLDEILEIEKFMGRHREERYGPRNIDIDIIFYDSRIIAEPGLRIPHPRLQDRRFVLMPLNELAPDWEHPIFHKTIRQLLAECPDSLHVEKFMDVK